MRYFLMLLSVVVISTHAQSVNTKITGSLQYPTGANKNVSMLVWDNENLFQRTRTISTQASSGYFEFELLLSEMSIVYFTIGEMPLRGNDSLGTAGSMILIEPGDNLHITIPSERSSISDDVIFSGKGSKNQMIVRGISHELKSILFDKKIQSYADRGIAAKKIIDSSMVHNKHLISKLAYNQIKAILLGIFHREALSQFEYLDLADQDVQKLYCEKIVKQFPLNSIAVKSESGQVYTDDSGLRSRVLMDYLAQNSIRYDGQKYLDDPQKMLEIIHNCHGDDNIKNRVIASYLIWYVKLRGQWSDVLDELVNKYFSQSSSTYKNQVELLRASIKNNLGEKADALGFTLQDSSDNTVDLNQFKGRVVLLDFYFYGCTSCAAIAPKLEALERHFNGKGITFISISVDPTLDLFKKGIGNFSSSTSLNFYTNGEGLNHPVIIHYSVLAFPTLVLIGKNGKVISSRAPDPRKGNGEAELIELIENSL